MIKLQYKQNIRNLVYICIEPRTLIKSVCLHQDYEVVF